MELVDAIHEASGIARRLIIRAAYRNYHSDMGLNEHGVMEKIHEHLLAEMTSDSVIHTVGYAAYDHQAKVLHLTNPEANFDWSDSQIPTGLEARTDTHQDPHYCVVSFGNETIPLAVRALLPGLCGLGTASSKPPEDNAFRTVASMPTIPTVLCGLAEASYAVQHKNNPHEGDKNFRSLKKLIIVCSDDTYATVVHEMLADAEFQKEYLPMLRLLQPEGLHVVNLRLNAPTKSAESFVLQY